MTHLRSVQYGKQVQAYCTYALFKFIREILSNSFFIPTTFMHTKRKNLTHTIEHDRLASIIIMEVK
ncbi:hypothetical protein HMPREF0908_0790 [Selenomonas flueggei ATCC 43531]|uniref:Uncharacterized protein n=1 Tax=Selenomonas flueggei ATCC 43531 TaxID=638302 RepID=C4V2P6_9FIRM|nr:hypothetical protein HMPREF0908_0790 [Selenomonas flueggei ATCC 43531]